MAPAHSLRLALVVLIGCSTNGAKPSESAPADSGADAAKSCSRDARGLPPIDYVPTARVPGACTTEDILIFGDDCGVDPSSKKCAGFLASSPTCARCLLGESLAGPLRRNANRLTEISPGTCGQMLAGESYDAGAEAAATPVGGCGKIMENVGACVSYACGACDGGDVACRVAAYNGQCSTIDPDLPRCDKADAGSCVLGTPADRARVIAAAVCGGTPLDAGTLDADVSDAISDAEITDASMDGGD